jgi:AraC-like DNA-binding protein
MVTIGNASPPLARFARFSSDSFEFVRDAMTSAYCDHRIAARDRSPRLAARHHQAELLSASVNYLTYGAPIVVTPPELPDFYLIDFPLSGRAKYRVGNREFECAAGQGCIVSPGFGLRTEWSADCELMTIKFARRPFEQFLADLLGCGLTEQLRFEPELDCSSGAGASLRALVGFLTFELDHSDALRRVPRWCSQMERTIAIGLLSTQRHNYSERVCERGQQVRPRHVRRAEAFIRANLSNDIDVEMIAAAAGVPARTLFAAYRRAIGMAPIAHFRELRLQAAHADLQRATAGESVAVIACRWGFYHLGHFSRDYRERFGQLPSQTLKANN